MIYKNGGISNQSPQKLKDLPSPYKFQVGSLALGKDPSLGAHPHELEGFGLADSSDSNFLDS